VTGEGMPIIEKGLIKVENYGKSMKKGNLYIRFEISFPTFLSEEKKLRLKKIL
jgi:hypothetical protein